MKKGTIYGITALSLLLVVGASTFVFAFQGDGFGFPGVSNEDAQARHDAIQEAIQNQDYEGWKTLMESDLTEENFNALVERSQQMEEFRNAMDEARQSGDFSEVEALKEEYGMPGFGMMGHRGLGMGHNELGESDGGCPYAS